MRLSSGLLWPMPITLDVPEAFAKSLKPGSSKVALRDSEGVMLAVLYVEDVWQPDRKAEAQAVLGTTSTVHPGVDYLLNKGHRWYVGGRVEGLQLPTPLRFPDSSAYTVGPARGVRPAWAGAGSSPSRRATRCTARTTSSRSAPRRRSKPTC